MRTNPSSAVQSLPPVTSRRSIPHFPDNFSLVLGGPLYQLFLRARVTGSTMELLHRRIILFACVAWIPLVILTAFAGTFSSGVSVPFLVDLDAHVRFLIAIPILIAAELIAHRRARIIIEQFLDHEVVAPEDIPAFQAIIARAMRLRNSVAMEVVLLLFAFTGGHWLWSSNIVLNVPTWYATVSEHGFKLTSAGYWYAFVSLPIARFLLLRWYFRFFIWYSVLFRISRLPLRLNPLHPDRAGGIGFLNASVDTFAPVLIAQSTFLAGLVGNHIWHEGSVLTDFKLEIGGTVIFLMLTVLLPLTFFAFHLARAKRQGLRIYGAVASHYSNQFWRKWLKAPIPPGDEMLGTADVQSLADLANSFSVVREMGVLTFDRNVVIRLAILILIPLLPLTLTMMPVEEMIRRLISLL